VTIVRGFKTFNSPNQEGVPDELIVNLSPR
jgi:hypothetical protein